MRESSALNSDSEQAPDHVSAVLAQALQHMLIQCLFLMISELPQFFNALKGNLSLVGPRPHAALAKVHTRLYHEVVDGYFARHRVKPGVTGWAQINGWRGETDTIDKIMQRVNHDLYYIEHWSILFDFYILLMTPVSLVSKHENAY